MVLLVSVGSSRAMAQGDHDHVITPPQKLTAEQKSKAGALVKAVRDITAGFQTPDSLPEGYGLMFGCVSGGDLGAMGLHFVNLGLVQDGAIERSTPEIVLYEPLPNGQMRITGADYLVYAADWDASASARSAAARWAALSSLRLSQSLRVARVLHAARLGVEGQPERHLHELEPQRLLRRIRPAE